MVPWEDQGEREVPAGLLSAKKEEGEKVTWGGDETRLFCFVRTAGDDCSGGGGAISFV